MKFEKYLEVQHALGFIGLDDDMPDDLDNWVSQLDVQEVIDYAQAWGDEMREEIAHDLITDIGIIVSK